VPFSNEKVTSKFSYEQIIAVVLVLIVRS